MKWYVCDKCHERYANPRDLVPIINARMHVCITCLTAAVTQTLEREQVEASKNA